LFGSWCDRRVVIRLRMSLILRRIGEAQSDRILGDAMNAGAVNASVGVIPIAQKPENNDAEINPELLYLLRYGERLNMRWAVDIV